MVTDFFTDAKDIATSKELKCGNTILFHVRKYHSETITMEQDPDTPGKEKEVKKISTIFKISSHKDVQSVVDTLRIEAEKKEKDAVEAKRKADDAKRKAEEESKRTGQPIPAPIEPSRLIEKSKIIDEFGGGIFYVFKNYDGKELITGYVDS